MRAKFTTVNGVRTRYHTAGSGYPLVLVHGVGISSESWLRNIDELGQDFWVIAPDCLGQGFTESGHYTSGPPQPPTVDHLIALLDQLGVDKFAIGGSSFGAMISILTYFKLPQRVEKLILVSSGSSTLAEAELEKTLKESYANGAKAYHNPTYDVCLKRLQNVFYNPDDVPREVILMQLTTYRLPGVLEAYETRMKGLMDFDAVRPYRTAERLHEIKVPTLLMWGLNDPRVIFARAEEAARKIERSTLVSFDKCKHFPHMEHPARFNRVVRKFLKGESLADEARRAAE